MGLLALLATGDAMWRLYGDLPGGALRSDRLRVVHDIATIWDSAPPDVLMLGGSQLRELMPEDALISAALAADCGRPIRVFNAATSSQVLEASWSVAEHLRRPGQLVVINLNVWRFVDAQNEQSFPRTLLPFPRAGSMPVALDQVPMSEISRRQNRLGILFADAASAVGLRGSQPVRSGPFASFQHFFRDQSLPGYLKMIDARSQAARLRPIAGRVIELNTLGFAAMARHLRTEQIEVVFVLAPASPEIRESLHEFRELENRAKDMLLKIAPLLDLRDAPALSSADFADALHLTTHGRTRLWPVLRPFLRSAVPGCTASGRT